MLVKKRLGCEPQTATQIKHEPPLVGLGSPCPLPVLVRASGRLSVRLWATRNPNKHGPYCASGTRAQLYDTRCHSRALSCYVLCVCLCFVVLRVVACFVLFFGCGVDDVEASCYVVEDAGCVSGLEYLGGFVF